VKVASELSNNLRLIIKALDNKESSELWRGAKSNLQIFNLLKEEAQPLPKNFKIWPIASVETRQLSPEEIKPFMGDISLKPIPQVKKESIYPEFREQVKPDTMPAKSLIHNDSNRKIEVVGSQSDGVVS